MSRDTGDWDSFEEPTKKEAKFNAVFPPSEIMQWFSFAHLPEGPMRDMSARFAQLAEFVESSVWPGPEKSTALRKLLEGKDAAVRAAKPK